MKETWSCTFLSQLGVKENFQIAIFVIASFYLLFNREDLLISECLASIYNIARHPFYRNYLFYNGQVKGQVHNVTQAKSLLQILGLKIAADINDSIILGCSYLRTLRWFYFHSYVLPIGFEPGFPDYVQFYKFPVYFL